MKAYKDEAKQPDSKHRTFLKYTKLGGTPSALVSMNQTCSSSCMPHCCLRLTKPSILERSLRTWSVLASQREARIPDRVSLEALWFAMESSRALSPGTMAVFCRIILVDTSKSTTMWTGFRMQLLPTRDPQSLCSHYANKVKFSLKKKKKVCKPAGQYTSYKLTISTNNKFKKFSANIDLFISKVV